MREVDINMLDRRVISMVLKEALKKGGEFAEIYVEEKNLTGIVCEDDKIEKVNSGRNRAQGYG